jgi:CheY-like chemotaxis protein
MDIRIEGDIDGIETAVLINEISKIPIVYTSGNSDKKTTERAEKTNMLSFLIKPINKQDLINLICGIK